MAGASAGGAPPDEPGLVVPGRGDLVAWGWWRVGKAFIPAGHPSRAAAARCAPARRWPTLAASERWPAHPFPPAPSLPGIYVGGMASLQRVAELGVTHVVVRGGGVGARRGCAGAGRPLPSTLQPPPPTPTLFSLYLKSVINGPPPPPPPGGAAVATHHVDVEDDEAADLLHALPATAAFVDSARRKGGIVLIHCVAGVSRGPAVAAACVMAAGGGGGLDAALAAVRAARPATSPNPAFLEQLALFDSMRCGIDRGLPAYRAWAARALAERLAAGNSAGALSNLPIPGEGGFDGEEVMTGGKGGDAAAGDGADAGTGAVSARPPPPAPPCTHYSCRACRRLVATSTNAVPVSDAPLDRRGFEGKRRPPPGARRERQPPPVAPGSLGVDGGSVFVEPLAWMKGALEGGDVEGKLYCPGCAGEGGAEGLGE